MPARRDPWVRFAEKVEWGERSVNGARCLMWTAYVHPTGYAHFHPGGSGSMVRAHRWLYERWFGPIPDGLVLDHLCRNRSCVNPAHLDVVTQQENILRGKGLAAANARKTHCPKGHPYDEANTDRSKGRQCRTCMKEWNARYYQRKKARIAALVERCAVCGVSLPDGADHWTDGEPLCFAHCPECSGGNP